MCKRVEHVCELFIEYAAVQVQNIRPGFKWGFWMGMINAGLETYVYSWLFGGPLWTVPANVPDREATKPAASCKRIDYPPCVPYKALLASQVGGSSQPLTGCISC